MRVVLRWWIQQQLNYQGLGLEEQDILTKIHLFRLIKGDRFGENISPITRGQQLQPSTIAIRRPVRDSLKCVSMTVKALCGYDKIWFDWFHSIFVYFVLYYSYYFMYIQESLSALFNNCAVYLLKKSKFWFFCHPK